MALRPGTLFRVVHAEDFAGPPPIHRITTRVLNQCVLLQRDSRRIGLWRSGRERGVWLLDIQRAAAARSVCAAAYAASIIRDR